MKKRLSIHSVRIEPLKPEFDVFWDDLSAAIRDIRVRDFPNNTIFVIYCELNSETGIARSRVEFNKMQTANPSIESILNMKIFENAKPEAD